MNLFFVERVVGFCARYAGRIVLAVLVLGAAAGYYTVTHFEMNTDTESLISSNTSWRKLEIAHNKAFPRQTNLIAIVIDGVTPERAEEAASSLTAALDTNPRLFPWVRRPDGGPFFAHNGLLFLPQPQVEATTRQMIAAQAFLGALASDPSLRGIMDSLSTALLGVQHGQAKLEMLSAPLSAFGTTLNDVVAGKPAYLSWRQLVVGGHPSLRETRRIILVQPRLDYEALMPGEEASDAIRAAARSLQLTPDRGVRVRLTGQVPIADEEFATLTENAGLLAAAMILVMVIMLRLAVRSFRLIFSIMLTVLTGLLITTAIGLFCVGAFNVISVAFVALFVGLGIDFGIQYCVRYRAERHEQNNLELALRQAGAGVGGALTLAAAATAVGFLSFLPTSYVGVAELGFVAGIGMLVTFGLTITFLPALLKILAPPGEPAEIGYSSLKPLDRYLTENRRFVMSMALGVSLCGLAALPALQFDFNPLDLRSPKVESVATALDLMKNPETSPNTIDVLAPNHAAAVDLAARISKLPQVSQVLTIDTFIPGDQPPKLAAIADASTLLDATLDPFVTKPPPTDAETIASMQATAGQLRAAAGTGTTKVADDARRLADILDQLARGTPELRARAADALVPGLQTMLTQAHNGLEPQPVTFQSLPQDLKQDWISPAGAYRIQVSPKGNANDNEVLKKFTAAVRKIAPSATGTPISIQEAGNTIVRAFVEAGVISFIAIVIVLAIALRSVFDLAMTLAPLILAGILTLATCVVIGEQLNYANIIVLPLLLGIGVAFDIYFVMAWRAGSRGLLQSPLTRAVILSAGTTASAFGTLWFSSHPGTASTGKLLAIALGWILASVLLLLPAMLAHFSPREGRYRG
ncbi:MAG: MMPL family transporter [Rhizomicrobium sp.]|jgi:hopanoid biosynthesis associated RND transporter like protein HpnN